jgi:hypothetical protein
MMGKKSGDSYRRHYRLIILASLVMSLGCRVAQEEEHEEHFPAHWPSNFMEAADRLQLIVGSEGVIETKAPSVEQEFVDLVDWLPELIADSPVTKEEFDQIDSWAYPMARTLKDMLKKGANKASLVNQPGLGEGLSKLKQIAEKEKERIAADERERSTHKPEETPK